MEERNLTLNEEKTKIIHTGKKYKGEKAGFEFLGFKVKTEKTKENGEGKTLIKPSVKKMIKHMMQVKKELKRMTNEKELRKKLDPIIRG